MAKVKPVYEVNDEFNAMAQKIVDKYPEHFSGIEVSKVCCVNIINSPRPETKNKLWEDKGVPMPIAMHCPYAWYIILYSSDWDEFGESTRLLLVSEILHSIARDEKDEGKVIPFDIKGYSSMFRTFGTIDYLEESDMPNILEEEIKWK